MRPPRRWVVWMVVVVVGGIAQTRPALADPRQALVMPCEAPDEQSSDPDQPVGPGQRQYSTRQRSPAHALLTIPSGPHYELLLTRAVIVLWSQLPSIRQAGRI
jgi:hypothetical protein